MSRYCHITPALADLHWLTARHRINFKMTTTAFTVLHHQQPLYLAQILPRYTTSRSLRFSSSIAISAPLRRIAISKSFSSTASRVWNKLPTHVSSAVTLPVLEGISSTLFSLMPTLVSLHQRSKLTVSRRTPNAFQPTNGQSRRASFSAKDTRWSCIPRGSGPSMEQPTVTCHIIFIVGVIQTQSQDWAVPEIVRSSLISANANFFDFVTCPRSQHWFTSR